MQSVKATPSKRGNPISELDSHVTILKPSESMRSDAMSVFGSLMAMDNSESWSCRIRFIAKTMSFCLGPGNLWRFPRQAFYFGKAVYIYLYVIYVWIFGTSLFIFEVGQSQYYSKGFAKIYSLCPVMQGITVSMAFYCIMASILYSMVNIYSFVYLFSAVYGRMPHAYCSDLLVKFNCMENSTNWNNTPEYLYFYQYVINAADIGPEKMFNWRNLGILIVILAVTCLMILFSVVQKYRWLSLVGCVAMILALIFSVAVSFTLEGTRDGILKMFVPVPGDLGSIMTWVYSMEQTLVTMGMGAGPLLTFWSVSKMKILSYIDCVLINGAVFICTILSGMIFFNAVSVVTSNRNITFDSLLQGYQYEDIQTHIIVTEGINMMTAYLNNFTIAVFYLLLFISCCCTVMEYLQVLLLYVCSFECVRKFPRSRVIIAVCIVFFLCTSLSATKVGYTVMMSMDKIFIGTSLLFIMSCELIAMAYIIGMHNLCDDIEFMLGFVPNYYFQITWLILPSLLFVFFVCSLVIKIRAITDLSDTANIALVFICTVMPVVLMAIIKLCQAIKLKDFTILYQHYSPDQVEMEDAGDIRSRRSSLRHQR